MRSALIFLPILILAIFESSIVPAHLTLLSIISWSVLREARQGLLTAFVAGLALDFLTGRTFGLTSLLFLVLSLVIYFYKNRFQANRLAFLLPFTFVSVSCANFVSGLPFLLIRQLAETVLIIFFLPLFDFLSKILKEKEQLKLSFEEKL